MSQLSFELAVSSGQHSTSKFRHETRKKVMDGQTILSRATLNRWPLPTCFTVQWGPCAFIIESKVQWKPFWLATQQYPQNDWLGGNFPNIMMYAHAPPPPPPPLIKSVFVVDMMMRMMFSISSLVTSTLTLFLAGSEVSATMPSSACVLWQFFPRRQVFFFIFTDTGRQTYRHVITVAHTHTLSCTQTNKRDHTQWFTLAPFAYKGRWRNFHVLGALSSELNFKTFFQLFGALFLLCS